MFTRWKANLLALVLVGAATTFISSSPADAGTRCDKGEFCVFGNSGNWWTLVLDYGGNWTGSKTITSGQVWNNGVRHTNYDHIDVVIVDNGVRLKTCLHYGPARYDHEGEPTQREMSGTVTLKSVTWRGECQSWEDDGWRRF